MKEIIVNFLSASYAELRHLKRGGFVYGCVGLKETRGEGEEERGREWERERDQAGDGWGKGERNKALKF